MTTMYSMNTVLPIRIDLKPIRAIRSIRWLSHTHI